MNLSPLISLGEIKDIIKELWHDFKPIIFLSHYEKGVVLNRGRFSRRLELGINFKIPFWEDYITVDYKPDTSPTNAVHVTTTDDKTITAVPMIAYEIEDEVLYLIENNESKSNLHDITRAIVSDYLTDCTWEECKLKRTSNAITKKVAEEAKELGINVKKVRLTDMCVSRVIITQI